jgi:hypothetical protein
MAHGGTIKGMAKQKNATGWIGRALAAGSIQAVAGHITATYFIPIGAALMTGYAGYIQGLPWMYIMIGAGLMFAAITTGLVKFDEWRDRRRVEGKLAFVSVRAGRNIRGPGVFLGILLTNNAKMAISLKIHDVRTRIGDQVPAASGFTKTEFVMQPGNSLFFDDHIINITAPPRSSTLEGFAEFNIEYGRLGMMTHDLCIKKQVILAFNSEGLLEHASWGDAA